MQQHKLHRGSGMVSKQLQKKQWMQKTNKKKKNSSPGAAHACGLWSNKALSWAVAQRCPKKRMWSERRYIMTWCQMGMGVHRIAIRMIAWNVHACRIRLFARMQVTWTCAFCSSFCSNKPRWCTLICAQAAISDTRAHVWWSGNFVLHWPSSTDAHGAPKRDGLGCCGQMWMQTRTVSALYSGNRPQREFGRSHDEVEGHCLGLQWFADRTRRTILHQIDGDSMDRHDAGDSVSFEKARSVHKGLHQPEILQCGIFDRYTPDDKWQTSWWSWRTPPAAK